MRPELSATVSVAAVTVITVVVVASAASAAAVTSAAAVAPGPAGLPFFGLKGQQRGAKHGTARA